MSIHQNAAGERCTGVVPAEPWLVAAHAKALRIRDEQRRDDREDRARLAKADAVAAEMASQSARKRERHLRNHPADASASEARKRYADIRAKIAADEQREREKRKNSLFGMSKLVDKMDRKIYATDGAYTVRGGLPTLGRGH
ncbi:hypothetical protein RCH12_002788 [Cryobacterium sp. MP_3.1]|nr:hypothetical protein [Cryobacterium sp. MP_3.1]